MKEELYITFHSEDDIRHFVDTCNEFDDAIDIRIQKMEWMQSHFWECS